MKIDITECDESFYIVITPENVIDVAKMVRCGMNATKKCNLTASVYKDGTFYLEASIGKKKRSTAQITGA